MAARRRADEERPYLFYRKKSLIYPRGTLLILVILSGAQSAQS